MKYFLLILSVCIWNIAVSQTTQTPDQIRQQMAKIRQTTNWDDPAAAKKANEEIKKLASQLSGKPVVLVQQQNTVKSTPGAFNVKTPATKESVVTIADRFYKRAYKKLDAVSKFQFDQDFKTAGNEKFNHNAVRKLGGTGAALITFGNDHNIACVYLAAAVKAMPADTLTLNNFGGYLRIIDSIEVSIPVLQYANKLFSESPVILTQLGCSYLELNDEVQGEKYLKLAIKYNPDFGQAHSALCNLYLKQGRLKDAFIELLAGVKGMGCSYSQASNNFAYLQEQANGESNEAKDLKRDMWDENKKQMNPSDALASLVPTIERIKMPQFRTSDKVEDWLEGGGYSSAVRAYSTFQNELITFSYQFNSIELQLPSLPDNAVLRDYPNERLALDILTELFFKESDKISKDYQKSINEITNVVGDAKERYLKRFEQYSKEYASALQKCLADGDEYCVKECTRKFCLQECPNANQFNNKLQEEYKNFHTTFSGQINDQTQLLDDFYGFAEPWFQKIYSPYWSRIYAFEIQRVALSIIGNCFGSYPQPFPMPAHNQCGTDCSIFAKPTPLPEETAENKNPKGNDCPQNSNFKISIAICDLGFDCESVEFGCTMIASAAIKKNFRKDNTTFFIGVGAKAELGIMGASAKAGATVTISDKGEVEDVGVKMDVSVNAGVGMARVGATSGGSYTVMKGASSKLNFSSGLGKPK